MWLEIVIASLTILRLAWTLSHPIPKDVPFYVLPGLNNLRKLLRYEPSFSYVPYGLVWYAINIPIVRVLGYNARLWITSLILADMVFLWYSSQMGLMIFSSYVMIGTFQMLRAPWNISINWLIMLAPVSWLFLLLAPVAKFPVGLPRQVWSYTRRGIVHQHTYIYFGLLGTLWLIVFNHLFLFPRLDNLLVLNLGIAWSLILGNAWGNRTRK